jgi:hypothetical protein
MASSFEIENKHEISREQLNNMNDYYHQALMGTINLSLGIVITGVMIIKFTVFNKNV